MTTEPTGTTNEALTCYADPGLPAATRKALRLAISDPGATTPRGDDYREHITDWQMRAVLAVLDVPDLTRRLVEAEAKVARVEAWMNRYHYISLPGAWEELEVAMGHPARDLAGDAPDRVEG